ncbi:MAG TPA: AMP-binding protein, partial [bacterium]|nr:AMP-binding protein [bacterium]
MSDWFQKATLGSLPERAAQRFGEREALLFRGRRPCARLPFCAYHAAMGDWFEKATLGSLPERAARRFGEREALAFQGRRLSFADLAREADRAAQALLAVGVRPGDKVSLWLPNRPEWLHVFFGALRIGAVVVPLNTRLRSVDMAYVLGQSNSTTLVCTDRSGPADYLATLQQVLPGLGQAGFNPAPGQAPWADFPDLQRVLLLSETAQPGTVPWVQALAAGGHVAQAALAEHAAAVRPDDAALILYTSGTTGFPKGVVQSHALVRNMTDHANRMGVTANDVILMFLPLFHVFGLTEGPLVSLLTGARQVLTESFIPEECLDLIQRERATLMHGFDTHFLDLLNAQERQPRDVSSLRTGICCAGMHSSTAVCRRVNEVFMPTLTAFGMSECSVGACLSFLDSSLEQRCESSGYPAPGYEIRVVDPQTGQDRPPEVPGEIWVRGYMLMQGYYRKPEETARVLDAQGWLHSGDMGILRRDGYLRFLGRYKDMLKIGGENVDPMEVEGFLLGHPDVLQVSVVGYPDARLQEVGVAFVQPKPGRQVSPEQVLAFCRGQIASFKIPRHVLVVQDFPMTS